MSHPADRERPRRPLNEELVQEIKAALQEHDFSSADPKTNWWANRCEQLLIASIAALPASAWLTEQQVNDVAAFITLHLPESLKWRGDRTEEGKIVLRLLREALK